jgi:hypothetical protein
MQLELPPVGVAELAERPHAEGTRVCLQAIARPRRFRQRALPLIVTRRERAEPSNVVSRW